VGGNLLDLVACVERCSIREAALRLQSRCQEPVGFSEQLVSKGRSISDGPEKLPILPFCLRLRWHPYLQERGIDRQTAIRFGVGYYTGAGFLRGRMVFPIHDERGELMAYAGRTMNGSEPRYLFPPRFPKSQVVYNLHRAAEVAAWAVVVEGCFDCLKVHQAGYRNVVALMGASFSARQLDLLKTRFGELVLMLDGDAAGRRARQAWISRWPAASWVEVPEGQQPDQLSAQEIQRILRGAAR